LVAQLHAPDLANHVHGDHLESLLKFSAGQWNTLVNFESALCGLAGQYCIGTNRKTQKSHVAAMRPAIDAQVTQKVTQKEKQLRGLRL
jgi:hypothetical protein